MIHKVFEGEEMECCMCGKEERHTPGKEKEWCFCFLATIGNVYACQACTPGVKGSAEDWRCFWMRMIVEATKLARRRGESPAGR